MSTPSSSPSWPGRPRRRAARAVAAAAVLAALPAAARVFERWGRATHGPVSAGQPGWNLAYETTLRINGGGGRMEVVGCELELGEALRTMDEAYRAMGASTYLVRGPRMAWGLVLRSDTVISLLAVALTPARECVLFRMEQTREAFRNSVARPARHLLREVPVPPGAEPRLYVADEGTDLALEVSATGAPAGSAASFLESALVSEGWTPLMQPDPRVGAHPVIFYARGRELCAFRARASDAGTVVTRLHKRRE